MSQHILLVDDSAIVAQPLQRALSLSLEDVVVEVCVSAEEALPYLEANEIALLITDLRLPGMNGLELIHRAQAASPQTRIILMTAFGSSAIEAEAQRLGTIFLAKPFNLSDFLRLAQDALKNADPK